MLITGNKLTYTIDFFFLTIWMKVIYSKYPFCDILRRPQVLYQVKSV